MLNYNSIATEKRNSATAHIDEMDSLAIATAMNNEDHKVPEAIKAVIITHPGLAKITMFDAPMAPGRGGIIAVLLAAAFAALLEKQLRKIVPEMLNLFLVPFFTVLIAGFATCYILLSLLTPSALPQLVQWLPVALLPVPYWVEPGCHGQPAL